MNLPIDIITTILLVYNYHNNLQLKSLPIKLEFCINLV